MISLSASLLGWFAALGVCGFGVAVATGPARRAALFVAAGLIVAWLARTASPPGWSVGLACLVDMGLLVSLISLAWKPQARWPLVLVALQGLIVALDVLRALEPEVRASTFSTATVLVGAGVLATLIYAAWTSRRMTGLSS